MSRIPNRRLGAAELAVLKAIERAGDWVSASEIAEATGYAPNTVSAALWRLTNTAGAPYATDGKTRGRRYRATAATRTVARQIAQGIDEPSPTDRRYTVTPPDRIRAAYEGRTLDDAIAHEPTKETTMKLIPFTEAGRSTRPAFAGDTQTQERQPAKTVPLFGDESSDTRPTDLQTRLDQFRRMSEAYTAPSKHERADARRQNAVRSQMFTPNAEFERIIALQASDDPIERQRGDELASHARLGLSYYRADREAYVAHRAAQTKPSTFTPNADFERIITLLESTSRSERQRGHQLAGQHGVELEVYRTARKAFEKTYGPPIEGIDY